MTEIRIDGAAALRAQDRITGPLAAWCEAARPAALYVLPAQDPAAADDARALVAAGFATASVGRRPDGLRRLLHRSARPWDAAAARRALYLEFSRKS